MRWRRASAGLGLAAMLAWPVASTAGEVVDQNPFAPDRKPWKEEKPVPELPELTPKDMQIEAIIAFGAFRGVVAQLDGKLKNALPTNAAGKVRIQVGQNFGGGYVLAAVEANQAVVQTGNKRFIIPLVRRVSKGGPPAPVVQAPQEPAPTPPPSAPSPSADNQPPGLLQAIQHSQSTAQAAAQPAPQQPPEQAANTPPAGQPNSLLDAIRQAQEASAAKGRGAATGATGAGGTPFGAAK